MITLTAILTAITTAAVAAGQSVGQYIQDQLPQLTKKYGSSAIQAIIELLKKKGKY